MTAYTLGDRNPALAPSSWIAPGAHVIGGVSLAAEASIWFGAVVRGDNDPIVIGAGSNVQDGAVLHSDPGVPLLIGDGVTIGHLAMVHSCTIGDHSLIGIGAIILAGARIGRECLIAAGALVTGGAVIPDGMMVIGRPGKVARMLTPNEIAGLHRSAEAYAAKARRFGQDLRAI
jgi:carbonic anhydrase/acetyltransferase-like protein (isoleucine patch superfamily)